MQLIGRYGFHREARVKDASVPCVMAIFELRKEERPEFWLTVPEVGDLRFKRLTSGAIFQLGEVRP